MFTFTPRIGVYTCVLLGALASTGNTQTATANAAREPDYRVQVWAHSVEDFNTRVWAYFELRRSLQQGLIALKITDNPEEIERAEKALATRLRVARAGVKQGEVFSPAIGEEFKKALIIEMDARTWEAIMDDNPGDFSHQITGTYEKDKPLSTVPPNVLALLPKLPVDIEYRFLGRHLILHDTRANVIIDRIPYAIRCAECEDDD